MEYLLDGLKAAFALLLPPQWDIMQIVLLSLLVSGSATAAASLAAVPAGVFLALREFRGKRFIIALLNTAMSIPAVLLGLIIYIILNRRGLLGFLGLLFTPWAMIIAQAILIFPIIAALSLAALKNTASETKDLAYSLGASRRQMAVMVIKEGRFAFLSAIIMGFSRAIGETGMAIMVGGNIKGDTRVMTTAISLETMKGNFEIGLALGLILLLTALLINGALQLIQGK